MAAKCEKTRHSLITLIMECLMESLLIFSQTNQNHLSPIKPDSSHANYISPGTGPCHCYFSTLCFTHLQSFWPFFFPKTISGPHQMKAAGVGAQGEPNHCGSNVTGLSSFIAKKTAHETTVYIIQHMQWFVLF